MSYARHCRLMAEAAVLRARAFELERDAARAWDMSNTADNIRHLNEMAASSHETARGYLESAELSERLADSAKADVYESRASAHEALGNPKRAAYLRRMAKRLRQAAAP